MDDHGDDHRIQASAPVAFYFRQRHGKLDWKRLARIDVDAVVREVDIALLQEHVDEVAFSEITAEDIPPTASDDLSVKLIRLSQLTIEYLLHVQDCQEGYIHGLVRQLEAANDNNQRLKEFADLAAKDGRRMKRESAQYQGVLSTCQSLLRENGINPGLLWAPLPPEVTRPGERAGAAGAQPKESHIFLPAAGPSPSSWGGGGGGAFKQPAPPASGEVFEKAGGGEGGAFGRGQQGQGRAPAPETEIPVARVCDACGKAFSSEFYLSKHMDRRHPDLVQQRRQQQQQQQQREETQEKAATLRPLPAADEQGDAEKAARPPTGSAPSRDEETDEVGGTVDGGKARVGGAGEQAAAAAAKAKDGDDDDRGAAEVAEGARRLGELVREREHARFRSEVAELRKEIEDLKKNREASQLPPSLPQPQPVPQPLPSPVASSWGNGERRRRGAVRGVIAIRRILREQTRRRKERALRTWRRVASGSRAPPAVAAPVAESPPSPALQSPPPPPPPPEPIQDRLGLEDLLSIAHRKADCAAAEASGADGSAWDGVALPSHGLKAFPLQLGSGIEVRANFALGRVQAEAARAEVARELRDRARSYGVDIVSLNGRLSGDEYRAKLGGILERRNESCSSSTTAELSEAYALVAKELQLSGGFTTRGNGNGTGVGAGGAQPTRRPSSAVAAAAAAAAAAATEATAATTAAAGGARLSHRTSSFSSSRPGSSAAGGGGGGGGGGALGAPPPAFAAKSLSHSVSSGRASRSGGNAVAAPFLTGSGRYSRWQSPASRARLAGQTAGAAAGMEAASGPGGLGSFDAAEWRFERNGSVSSGGTGSAGGVARAGGSGADSKDLLAIAKRTAEINWEAVKRRRSVSEAAEAAEAAAAAAAAAAGSTATASAARPAPAAVSGDGCGGSGVGNSDRTRPQRAETAQGTSSAPKSFAPEAAVASPRNTEAAAAAAARTAPPADALSPAVASSSQRSRRSGIVEKAPGGEPSTRGGQQSSAPREARVFQPATVTQEAGRKRNEGNPSDDVSRSDFGRDSGVEQERAAGDAAGVSDGNIAGVESGARGLTQAGGGADNADGGGAVGGGDERSAAAGGLTVDTAGSEGGWAFATSIVSPVEDSSVAGVETAAPAAGAGRFEKYEGARFGNRLSFSDDDEGDEGERDSEQQQQQQEQHYNGGDSFDSRSRSKGHSETVATATVATASAAAATPASGRGATTLADRAMVSIPGMTRIRKVSSFSSSEASPSGEENLDEDYGEARPRKLASARETAAGEGVSRTGRAGGAQVVVVAQAPVAAAAEAAEAAEATEVAESPGKSDAAACRSGGSAPAAAALHASGASPIAFPPSSRRGRGVDETGVHEAAAMRVSEAESSGGLKPEASVVRAFGNWDDDDSDRDGGNARSSGASDGSLSPRFPAGASSDSGNGPGLRDGSGEPIPPTGIQRHSSGQRRVSSGSNGSSGGGGDGGAVGGAGMDATAKGEGKGEEGQGGQRQDGDIEVKTADEAKDSAEVQTGGGSDDSQELSPEGPEGPGDGFRIPTYGFFTVGSGLASFPKRNQLENVSAEGGESKAGAAGHEREDGGRHGENTMSWSPRTGGGETARGKRDGGEVMMVEEF